MDSFSCSQGQGNKTNFKETNFSRFARTPQNSQKLIHTKIYFTKYGNLKIVDTFSQQLTKIVIIALKIYFYVYWFNIFKNIILHPM